VLLAGNIDVGGVFAQLVGTLQLLLPAERARVRGFLINKFRGDVSILKPGLDWLERETGKPVLGVIPHFRHIRVPEEDALPERDPESATGRLRIDVALQGRMANFTDFDALASEPDVSLRWIESPDGTIPDALILPGTKSTIADLRRLKAAGFAAHAAACLERGGTVAGICGGFQMLGTRVVDPARVEATSGSEDGLGLLPMTTRFEPEKITAQVEGVHLESGAPVRGYEIHMGRPEGEVAGPPFLRLSKRNGTATSAFDGAQSADGRLWGTYVHGIFDSAPFRRHFLNRLRAARGWPPVAAGPGYDVDLELDKLADHVAASVDVDRIVRILNGKE
jgi:adenosylcobyric acid synthase